MSGLLLLQLRKNVADSRGNIYLDTDAVLSVDGNGRAVGVVRRKQTYGLGREVDIADDVSKVPDDTALAEHNALALSRSSRGEYQKRHSIRVNLGSVVGCAVSLELLYTLCKKLIDRVLRCEKLHSERICNRASLSLYILVTDNQLGVCALSGSGEVLSIPIPVKRDKHGCGTHRSVVAENPVIRILSYKGDVLSRIAARDESGGKTADILSELGICLSVNLSSWSQAVGIRISVSPSDANILYHMSDVGVVYSFANFLFSLHNYLLQASSESESLSEAASLIKFL